MNSSTYSSGIGNIYHAFASIGLIYAQSTSLYGSDVYNKIDAISLEQMDKLAHEDHTVVISCEMGLKYVSHVACYIDSGADTSQTCTTVWTISLSACGTTSV